MGTRSQGGRMQRYAMSALLSCIPGTNLLRSYKYPWPVRVFRHKIWYRYRIARKIGKEFNLVVWWIGRTAKLKLNHDITRNVCLLRCPPNFMLTPVEASPPNLIPANTGFCRILATGKEHCMCCCINCECILVCHSV